MYKFVNKSKRDAQKTFEEKVSKYIMEVFEQGKT